MLFKAKTPVKYRGRRIEIGEEVEAFKKDRELLEKYGEVKDKKEPAKKEPTKKEEPKEKEEK